MVRPNEVWVNDQPLSVPISFDSFYREHYRAVVGLVYTLTGSRSGSEDIAQEAFLRAHRDWTKVETLEHPGSWVRVVALNLARSGLRRRAAEARAAARIGGRASSPFPELEPHNERFWRTVRTLPRRQREVVALHYLEDLSVAELARLLSVAESTVKNSLVQARSKLARRLEVDLMNLDELGRQAAEEVRRQAESMPVSLPTIGRRSPWLAAAAASAAAVILATALGLLIRDQTEPSIVTDPRTTTQLLRKKPRSPPLPRPRRLSVPRSARHPLILISK
jgi:RNA polymerase sigma-70 factor (ECF subfamily)